MRILLTFMFLTMLFSCSKINRDRPVDKEKLLASDYRIYQNTPAWELAKAVWDNSPKRIEEEIRKNPKIINYQDKKYGMSLLHMSLYNGQFKSFKELLKLGANPNIYDFMHCTSPIIQACQDFDDKTEYVEELIKYGANVNDIECLTGKEEQKTNRTPLIEASNNGNLKLVKLLVKNRAKINYINTNSEYALSSAILGNNYDVVLYLLEQGADCSKVLYKKGGAVNPQNIYMKNWIEDEADHSSKEYNKIVEILKKRGCL